MKSIQADYEEAKNKVTVKKGAKPEDWFDVCKKFNDDVSRVKDVTDQKNYTGLFECFDDDSKRFFYLVEEDKELYRIKRQNFYENIGLK